MKDQQGIYSKPETKSFLSVLSRKKPVEKSVAEVTNERTLRWYDLAAYGISATVGSGLYATVGQVALDGAGPAVIFSILIAGLLSLLNGICYLEFASALPISGSGYAYFYALMGEFLGWFVGWNLTLEYGFCATVIAEVWSSFLVGLLAAVGLNLPTWLYNIPLGHEYFRVNVIAGVIILLLTVVVSRGASFGASFTNIITVTNIGIIIFIIAAGSFYVTPGNWSEFMPSVPAIFSGAGTMFFSYIGYDTVSTLAAEAINPARDIPIAIGITVGTATVLYMLVGLVLTGMIPYAQLDGTSPLMNAFVAVGAPKIGQIVSLLALLMMAATMFACLSGQPKIFQAIAKDGLLPAAFAKENSSKTPLFSVLASGIFLAAIATFVNAKKSLDDMIVFGTLTALSTLCVGLILVRFDNLKESKQLATICSCVFTACSLAIKPVSTSTSLIVTSIIATVGMGIPFLCLSYLFIKHSSKLASKSTAFSCPLMPVIPCMAILANSWVMMSLDNMTDVICQFTVWTLLGFFIYFTYGIFHSKLKTEHAA